MDLRKYLNFLRRRIFIIITVTAVTIMMVVIGTNYITPVYQASTVLRIALSAGGPLEYSDYMATDRLMNTYVEIATSRPVSEELVKTLGLTRTPTFEAEIIPNTELIKITVEDADPKRAATIANTLADILIAQSSQIYIGGGRKLTEVLAEQLVQVQADMETTQQDYDKLLIRTPAPREKIEATGQLLELKQTNYATLLSQYEQARYREEIQASMITVWETAEIPRKASKPNVLLNYVLGCAIGLIGGITLALVLENLDSTLYTTEDIEAATNLPALGRIPKADKKQMGGLKGDYSPLAEAFRNLATLIHHNNCQNRIKTMLVMSAQPDQGKTTIVLHLAISLAELGKRVLVIDCDTRIARLHKLFNLSNQCGLKDVLEQKATLEDAIQNSPYEGISVLTSGSPLAHPSQLLGSAQMANLIAQLKRQFDYILLDSPAFLATADVTALIAHVDCPILVVRRAHAKREALQPTVKFLEESKNKSIYLIVNHAESHNGSGYYHYGKKSTLLKSRFEKIFSKNGKRTVPAPGMTQTQHTSESDQNRLS